MEVVGMALGLRLAAFVRSLSSLKRSRARSEAERARGGPLLRWHACKSWSVGWTTADLHSVPTILGAPLCFIAFVIQRSDIRMAAWFENFLNRKMQ